MKYLIVLIQIIFSCTFAWSMGDPEVWMISPPEFSANPQVILLNLLVNRESLHTLEYNQETQTYHELKPIGYPDMMITNARYFNNDQRILFSFTRANSPAFEIGVMDRDGSHFIQLTDGKERSEEPFISFDEKRIGFVRSLAKKRSFSDVYVIYLETGIEEKVSTKSYYDVCNPSFSKDGETVYFSDHIPVKNENRFGTDFFLKSIDIKSKTTKTITGDLSSLIPLSSWKDSEKILFLGDSWSSLDIYQKETFTGIFQYDLKLNQTKRLYQGLGFDFYRLTMNREENRFGYLFVSQPRIYDVVLGKQIDIKLDPKKILKAIELAKR